MSEQQTLSFRQEVTAIGEVLESLQPLSEQARERVLEYVVCALGIGIEPLIGRRAFGQVASVSFEPLDSVTSDAMARPGRATGIRALKEAKQPRSANEMAALVAFYLSEVVPEPERRPTIEATDVQKYFNEAGFPLPKAINMTLTNAAGSGYFDRVEQGKFKLNAVGYNLVAHRLPPGSGDVPSRRGLARKKTSVASTRERPVTANR